MPDRDPSSSMTHTPKKKRVEDIPLPPDAGSKPIQLQRRRVWRACESCRRKKIKCDGVEPVCSQCSGARVQCTWLQTKDRAALSRHYVQELEARLLHMEEVFKQVAPILDNVGNTPNGASIRGIVSTLGLENGNITHPPTSTQPNVPREKPASEQSNSPSPRSPSTKSSREEDDVSESFGQLALDEHGHLRWIGGSSTMTLIQSFRTLTTSPTHRTSPMEEDPLAPTPSANKFYFPASVYFGKVHALPGPEEVEYPERDLADKLVNAYFSRLHFLMPVIDKPTFLVAYNHLMDHTKDVDLARSQTAFVALVFAVFACAARIVDDKRLQDNDDGGLGMVYYERALILHYISHASIQMGHVQCFVLLSSFLCAVNCLPQAWLLVGQAVRMAQDLGLHRFSRHLQITPREKELRRKVFWSVYSLDRMLALALGRPLGIEDSDCDAEMPIPYDDEDLQEYFSGAIMPTSQPSLITGFIALVELYKIAGRVCRQIYGIDKCKDNLEPDKVAELCTSVQILDKELTNWCEELPSAFKSNPSTEAQVSMGAVLCSHYYSILTTLHRNFLPVTRNQQFLPSANSSLKALHTARSCIRLAPSVRNVVPPSHHLAFFIQHLFSSAVIILLYAMHISDKEAAHAAMTEAESCMDVLLAWEGTWPGARKCRELLSDLASTAKEAIARGPPAHHMENRTNESSPYSNGVSAPSPPSTSLRRSDSGRVGRAPKARTVRNKSRDSRSSLTRAQQSASGPAPSRRRNLSQKRGLDLMEYPEPTGGPIAGSPPSSIGGFHARYHSEDKKPTLVENEGSSTSFSPLREERRASYPADSALFEPSLSTFSGDHNGSTSMNYVYPQTLAEASLGWTASGDHNHDSMFRNVSQDTDYSVNSLQFNTSQNTPVESNFMSYGAPLSTMMSQTQATTPPSSAFGGPGLPFPGLDFIRNYTPGLYEEGQDTLWQGFDGGEFRYDPDLPFSLGELPAEGTHP